MEPEIPAYMHGQLTALAMTIDALITHLPREVLQRVATTLAASEDVQREADELAGVPASVSRGRTAMISVWLEKLPKVESDSAGTPESPS